MVGLRIGDLRLSKQDIFLKCVKNFSSRILEPKFKSFSLPDPVC